MTTASRRNCWTCAHMRTVKDADGNTCARYGCDGWHVVPDWGRLLRWVADVFPPVDTHPCPMWAESTDPGALSERYPSAYRACGGVFAEEITDIEPIEPQE